MLDLGLPTLYWTYDRHHGLRHGSRFPASFPPFFALNFNPHTHSSSFFLS
jgi:hypothetical protein